MRAKDTTGPGKSHDRGKRILAGVALFGLWVLLSGKFGAFHLILGLVSVVGVLQLQALLASVHKPHEPFLRPLRLLVYVGWLLVQMIRSALHVAHVILRPEGRLDTRLVAFRSEQPSLLQGVILANSITLTPGTLTVDLHDQRYLVHALTAHTAGDLMTGEMAGRVAQLSGDSASGRLEEISPEEWRVPEC